MRDKYLLVTSCSKCKAHMFTDKITQEQYDNLKNLKDVVCKRNILESGVLPNIRSTTVIEFVIHRKSRCSKC